MSENPDKDKLMDLMQKLHRAQKQIAGLKEKSKLLEMQYKDAKEREQNNNELVMELIERQRELNVMLNRANIMLNRTQEAMALTSLEFNEMAKALPEPKKAEWAERVERINELFKKTGVQDADIANLPDNSTSISNGFSKDELKKESKEVFGKKQGLWGKPIKDQPQKVEAEIVEEKTQEVKKEEHEIIDHKETETSSEKNKTDEAKLDEVLDSYTQSQEKPSESESESVSTTDDSNNKKPWWKIISS
ncbi:MAG: hypothetical protein SNJ70_08320 [Armatimonadota bacterium]